MPSILAEKKPTASSSRAITDQSIGDAGKSMPAIPALQRKDTSDGALQLKAVQLKGDEEELPVQGKFTIQQKGGPEEEEPLQMKAFQLKSDTIQKEGAPEEEGLLQKKPFQLKNDTVQKAGPLEEEEPLQKKPFQLKSDTIQKAAAPEEELPVQGKLLPIQKKANNTGLPENLKSGVEQLSGFAMDDVKVHYNSSQPAQLNALAYAQGTDIHVAPGQEKHLPHEAWHVAQQKQGRVQPTMQMKQGVAVNDDPGLENEADVMGAKAVQMKIDVEEIPAKNATVTSTTQLISKAERRRRRERRAREAAEQEAEAVAEPVAEGAGPVAEPLAEGAGPVAEDVEPVAEGEAEAVAEPLAEDAGPVAEGEAEAVAEPLAEDAEPVAEGDAEAVAEPVAEGGDAPAIGRARARRMRRRARGAGGAGAPIGPQPLTVSSYVSGVLRGGTTFEHIRFSDGSYWSTKLRGTRRVYLDVRSGPGTGAGYSVNDDQGMSAPQAKNWIRTNQPGLTGHWAAYRARVVQG